MRVRVEKRRRTTQEVLDDAEHEAPLENAAEREPGRLLGQGRTSTIAENGRRDQEEQRQGHVEPDAHRAEQPHRGERAHGQPGPHARTARWASTTAQRTRAGSTTASTRYRPGKGHIGAGNGDSVDTSRLHTQPMLVAAVANPANARPTARRVGVVVLPWLLPPRVSPLTTRPS